MRTLVLVSLALAACTNSSSIIPYDDPAVGSDATLVSDDTGAALPGDTAAEDTGEPVDTGSSHVGPWPEPCADLYAQDIVPEFYLDFDAADYAGVQSDCRSTTQRYRPVQLTYNGETVDAEVRLKGNYSWNCDKFQFVVSFNETDPDGRFHGLRKLVFDAPWYDHSFLHERLAFPIYAAVGVPTSCVNNAKVYVNGEYYGLYASTERLDKEYLQRNFEEAGGNLYQGGTELKTNETAGDTSDAKALAAARTLAEIDELADLDEAVQEWAVEAMIPAMDNYWAGVEINYYLYDHPSQGFVWLPYDMDVSFGDAAWSDGSLMWPGTETKDPITWEHSYWGKEELLMTVLEDKTWCDRYAAALQKARDAYDPAALSARITALDAQIAPAFQADPNTPITQAQHDTAIARLQAFVVDRADYVDGWLAAGGHCPARF